MVKVNNKWYNNETKEEGKNNEEILKNINKFLKLADENLVRNPWSRQDSMVDIYLKEIINEIGEVKVEIRDDNVIYLEDELGDVFWDYLMILKFLEKEKKTRSVKEVFAHAIEKYKEIYQIFETDNIDDTDRMWLEIKNKQKKELKERHKELYKK